MKLLEPHHSAALLLVIFSPIAIRLASAQSCENYGFQNASTCACPTGFGGPSCSQIACGGNLFQGTQRNLTAASSSFANLTAAGCTCESGWTGTACNVCQTASVCQAGFTASGASLPSIPVTGSQKGQNNTLVCNTSPRVYASSQMSCQVNEPTLQSVFPLQTTLNIIRNLVPDFSPIPNTTSFGTNGTAYAQIFYAGVEQFYCKANSCTQQTPSSSSSSGTDSWNCASLACTCRTNATFCGGETALDISNVINTLSGNLTVACTPDGACHFQQSTLNTLFGPGGLPLSNCAFGECVQQGVIDNAGTSRSSNQSGKPRLSGGVIAGVAVVGTLVFIVQL